MDTGTCVADDRIHFDSKPNALNKVAPMFFEMKSRLIEDINEYSDTSSVSKLQNTECELLNQCIARVISQALFHQHFRKIVVLGSTG